ncbi:MbtH family protein [Paenibacillus bovis]|uniref:Protein mbtH n=1 Tax=Paenibacillus bovis TaxID=1616788 RepID=A0A172ZKD2_9BACL|nr:MbtH family protein [Paenibacillus bovis]ANF98086.1 protein mbtH [Paenibacillus bovis]
MNNPFEQIDGQYIVLINEEHQYSLWPAAMDIPAGWSVSLSVADRQTCMDYIAENWQDLRPRSIRQQTAVR